MSVIEEVKQRLDIVEVVGEYVPNLTKSGRSFKALCPFHSEKHASFYIFPERQRWHCFGSCAGGGDIFAFVMRKGNLDFGEALRLLADKAGVALQPKPQAKAQAEEEEKLHGVNEAAAHYYHHLLLNSTEAEGARGYLATRAVSPESIADFQLGFSPDSWDALCLYLADKGYGEEEALAAGLLVEKKVGGNYDRFRNRLMFPIRGTQGRVMGLGARALDDSLPKYLNSPQTALFDKSSILYGIDRAKTAIRRQNLVVVVEGYMDVIIAHQHGYDNVVASMGSALTDKHIGAIKRLTKNLTLALDADAAGDEATLRGVEVAAHSLDQKVVPVLTWRGLVRYENTLDAEVKVMVMPRGKDPDDIIKENAPLWQQLVAGALPVVDYTFNAVAAKLDLTKAGDKSRAVEQLLPLIAEMRDAVRRYDYLQKLARLAMVDERTLAALLRRPRPSREGTEAQPSRPTLLLSSSRLLEEYCLALLLQHPELRDSSGELSPDYFEHSENREIFAAWRHNTDLPSLRASLDAALGQHLDTLAAKAIPPASPRKLERDLAGCTLRLREQQLRAKEELLSLEAREVDAVELDRLREQGTDIGNSLRQVFIERREQRRTVSEEPTG
jgi:DNA primase